MTVPKVAIGSIGLGRASGGHTLPTKLNTASAVGFDGVELVLECLEHHARQLDSQLLQARREEALLAASKDVRALSDSLGLKILSLQPLHSYDALKQPDDRFAEALIWLNCMEILGAEWLQVPTCIFPLDNDQLDTSEENIIRNMRRLAEAAAKKNISIGYTLTCLEADVPMCDHVLIAPLHSYEAPAWGIAFNNWQDIDRVIRKIDRPNVKHCIDTFHIGALEWGDPESPDTKFKHADGEARLDGSLSQLKTRLKAEDIGYLQLSDACEVDLTQKDYPVKLPPGAPPHMIWSRNCRVNPCEPEHGSLFPAEKMAKAIFDTGYRGWCSIETFHPDFYSTRESVPKEWAERSMTSWKRIIEACGLK